MLTVQPPRRWGKLAGSVTGVRCDGSTTPLAGATIVVTSWAGDYHLHTGRDGTYQLWLDRRSNPLMVIASKDGWWSAIRRARVRPATTTSVDFTLDSAACARGR